MYLVNEVTSLQAQVGRDVLVNCPGKFVIQFPRDETECYRTQRKNAGHCDQERLNIMSKARFNLSSLVQDLNGAINLVVLDGSVYKETQVVKTKSDDLNRVLEA